MNEDSKLVVQVVDLGMFALTFGYFKHQEISQNGTGETRHLSGNFALELWWAPFPSLKGVQAPIGAIVTIKIHAFVLLDNFKDRAHG